MTGPTWTDQKPHQLLKFFHKILYSGAVECLKHSCGAICQKPLVLMWIASTFCQITTLPDLEFFLSIFDMASMSESVLPDSGKLDGPSNFRVWKFKMKNILMDKDCWNIVMDTEKKPAPADAKAVEDWEKRARRALTIINLSVRDHIIDSLSDATTASEAWKILTSMYETKNPARALFLHGQLQSLRMQPNEDINAYLARVKGIKDALSSIDEKIEDAFLVQYLLNGLNSTLQPFVAALSARDALPNFEMLGGMVLQEEQRLKNFNLKSSGTDEALYAKGKAKWKGKAHQYKGKEKETQVQGQQQRSTPKKKGDCYYCGKPGHYANECRKKKADANKGKGKRL